MGSLLLMLSGFPRACFRRADYQDRAFSVSNHLVGNAAQKPTTDAGPAMSSHGYQTVRPLPDEVHNGHSRMAVQ